MSDRIYDVAIVGFGPSGAVAATLLGQAGLDVWVADRLSEVYEIPRAIALDHEIMRVFQQMGVVQAIERYLEPFTPSEYYGVDGQLIRRMTMVEPPYPQGYTPSLVFTQPPVERALRARVSQLPNVHVALSTEVQSVEQDDNGVSLHIKQADGQTGQVRARWALACDGGASGVRGQLGVGLQDLDFDEPWLVVDVLVNAKGLEKLPKTSVQFCEPERPCTYVIGPGNHRRWEISLKPGEDPKEAATQARTWALLSRWLTPEDGEIWRQSSYRFHALVAEKWRVGRVFLAGDAAHMQPPFLGQGMCQGIRDVANLCWKLVAVLGDQLPTAAVDTLLNSYGDERGAHVRELTTRIKAVGAVICERDENKARDRDARLLAECGGVVKDTPRQDVMPALSAGLVRMSPGCGALFPQPWLLVNDQRMRMDELLGNGWRLVMIGATEVVPPVSLTEKLKLCVAAFGPAHLQEADGVVQAWFARHGVTAAVVRPDNYVYGTASGAEGTLELLKALAKALSI
ncbi:bifunctional 3-(3-hydroxy-phenyl)propionate/3-hydroxycinnamic acid hydroxylase [Azoarcus sp. L1K30]|uniref:bifunctional 3-(3-hydroxy-phenyl)propionate/3-hydroxycinnamic acid hydroxylase n=1 Tax=Azoarcus sp. L1K30 TaxID=2820277 RepID=UPI001B829FE9|nr:bifunctional 3-(3-hydroxy-phenyl)propionate/3-hydroxycinnamic acid hydroxylase [Azoarcus sp. L1K30]MBR0567892.1 bifunctional 3-(3-hydroxy-phenyl)propionate/3-hydroxycinnamic acid hydroxylase [Azoarcus sp. L1K30]